MIAATRSNVSRVDDVIIAINDSPTNRSRHRRSARASELPGHRHALTIRRAAATHQLVVMKRHL
jgi:S1-C subfamily serine protease